MNYDFSYSNLLDFNLIYNEQMVTHIKLPHQTLNPWG